MSYPLKILFLVFLTVVAACTIAPVGTAPRWAIPEGVKTAWVNGYPMAYQDTGTGIPLVLVHGSLNDYRIWYAQLPEFVKKYRVINISLRRYFPEKWDGKGGGFLITDHAEDVATLIKTLNLGKVHLLGHSRGGAVVVNVARLHPEVIRTLVLEDASGLETLLPETPETQRTRGQTSGISADLRRNLASSGPEKAAQEFVDALGGPGTWMKRTPQQRQMVLDNMGTASGDTGERPAIACSDIAKFNFPVLLVNGERSPKRYGEMFSAMRACNPSLSAPLIIPNAAHAMNRENPSAFNSVVLDFLGRH